MMKEPAMPRVLLSIEAVAYALSISPRYVKQLIQRGALRSVKVGARRLVAADDLADFVHRLRSAESIDAGDAS
jgi:excisionase family DNA binding protein